MAIGDYAIVLDGALAMSRDEDRRRSFSFTFSKDFTRRRACVLTWRAHVVDGSDLVYEIRLNDEVVWRTPSGLFNGDSMAALHEVVDGSTFRPGNREQALLVEVTSGGGRLNISDIVIHYGRDR